MVRFCDLVGVGIVLVSKKTAVKSKGDKIIYTTYKHATLLKFALSFFGTQSETVMSLKDKCIENSRSGKFPMTLSNST